MPLMAMTGAICVDQALARLVERFACFQMTRLSVTTDTLPEPVDRKENRGDAIMLP